MDPTMFISSTATMWKVTTSEWLIVVPERCCLHRWKPSRVETAAVTPDCWADRTTQPTPPDHGRHHRITADTTGSQPTPPDHSRHHRITADTTGSQPTPPDHSRHHRITADTTGSRLPQTSFNCLKKPQDLHTLTLKHTWGSDIYGCNRLELDVNQLELDDNQLELDDNRLELDVNRLKLDVNQLELDVNQLELDDNRLELDVNRLELDDNQLELDDNQLEMDDNQLKLDVNRLKLDVNQLKLDHSSFPALCMKSRGNTRLLGNVNQIIDNHRTHFPDSPTCGEVNRAAVTTVAPTLMNSASSMAMMV
ncbi:hypothetical protein EYF80_051686 [Liparis tanakae]|uniref:Uncharacterized protein n=1 Tax=Liparis tanakae TaxID=230148 RepID=A0A4Z2FAD2_9TELE|nr:hypothetical protein EYF80_051686 [Liparis tanakae]